jgi:hypothetical protein
VFPDLFLTEQQYFAAVHLTLTVYSGWHAEVAILIVYSLLKRSAMALGQQLATSLCVRTLADRRLQ